ncbi:MAG: class I SAM-dependent methyltransferase [Alphaproteobacteria bacterium]|nr:class I SAM-dependent methyltransferase [Alphaproteobacteria bacterium]
MSTELGPGLVAGEARIALLDRALARATTMVARVVTRGCIGLVLPDGSRFPARDRSGAPTAEIELRRYRMLRRLLTDGGIGFAEAYIEGDWDTPDLARLIAVLAGCQRSAGGFVPRAPWHRLLHLVRGNTRRGSRRNIAAHYDLGNDFFRCWLDRGMTYSSAIFADADESLEQAQARKYRRLAAMLALRPGMRVLEIGCGWGGFAEMAARDYGCHVTGLTLSREQLRFAERRIAEAGLSDRVELRLQDYRDVRSEFDRVASIEMFEAVGERHWPVFFDTLRARLRPGGVAALQIITIADQRFARYRRRADFIQRYIFPGGMLPSPAALARAIDAAGLSLAASETFASGYARTLAAWHRAFDRAWPQIAALGFDERFRRMWQYYLAYCEGGFRAGTVDVGQYRIERP